MRVILCTYNCYTPCLEFLPYRDTLKSIHTNNPPRGDAVRMKRYLFDSPDDLFDRIMHASSVLLFLDYDGTLVPIRREPSRATLSPRTKRALTTLSRIPGISVGIISGRPLSELKRFVGVTGLWYAGNHGFEISREGKV